MAGPCLRIGNSKRVLLDTTDVPLHLRLIAQSNLDALIVVDAQTLYARAGLCAWMSPPDCANVVPENERLKVSTTAESRIANWFLIKDNLP